MKLTKKEKLIWNEAVKQTVNEVKKWDGLIPSQVDRENMGNRILTDLSYKIKKGPVKIP